MSKKGFIFFGLAAALFIGATIYKNLKQTFDNLKYRFTGLKFNFSKSLESGLSNLFFTINLVLTNDYATTIIIHSLEFDVFFNGRKIATISEDAGVNILPKQTTINILNVDVLTNSLPSSIQYALKNLINQNTKFSFTFDGTVTTNFGTIPIKQTLKIGS